jgi:Protein of unknown function (DUF4019)
VRSRTPSVWVLAVLVALLTLNDQVLAANDTSQAERAAEQWLALIDSGKYGESWDQAATLFKAALPREQWVSAMQSMRLQLGVTNTRSRTTSTYTTTLPGAPAGEYLVIQFQSDFASKNGAIETVTPMKDDNGAWKVSGYYIR